jgi:hypothetical protein
LNNLDDEASALFHFADHRVLERNLSQAYTIDAATQARAGLHEGTNGLPITNNALP